jgi:hypothetical protein
MKAMPQLAGIAIVGFEAPGETDLPFAGLPSTDLPFNRFA